MVISSVNATGNIAEDIEGMVASEAIVTTHGGMTSHAAVVARGMGKCCVTGCSNVEIQAENGNKVVLMRPETSPEDIEGW